MISIMGPKTRWKSRREAMMAGRENESEVSIKDQESLREIEVEEGTRGEGEEQEEEGGLRQEEEEEELENSLDHDSEDSDEEIQLLRPLGMYFQPSEYTKKIKIRTRCYIPDVVKTLEINPFWWCKQMSIGKRKCRTRP